MSAGALAALTASARPAAAPPPSYTTGAVHVTGPDTSLRCASLAATDSGRVLFNWWYKLADYASGTAVIFVVDPNNDYAVDFDLGGGGGFVVDAHPSSEVGSLGFANETESTDALDQWHNVLVYLDTNKGIGAKINPIYLDDSPWALAPDFPSDTDIAFVMPFNGREFYLFDDGFSDGITADVADYSMWVPPPDVPIVDGGGAILESIRRLFISATGKPVDPATAIATLGNPTVLCRRAPSAAASTFADNLGTGGDFTITGTLTNAATSPSD